jgi:hypothetical protein
MTERAPTSSEVSCFARSALERLGPRNERSKHIVDSVAGASAFALGVASKNLPNDLSWSRTIEALRAAPSSEASIKKGARRGIVHG